MGSRLSSAILLCWQAGSPHHTRQPMMLEKEFQVIAKRVLGFSVLVVLPMLFTACGGSKGPVQLTFKQGETRRAEIKNDVMLSVTAMGVSFDTNIKLETELKMTTKSVDETGGATMDVVFDDFFVNITAPLERIAGEGPTRKQLDDVAEKVRGKVIEVHVTQLGIVEKISGLEEIQAAVAVAIHGERRSRRESPFGDAEQLIGEKSVRDMLQAVFGHCRKEPTAKGDSWTVTRAMIPGLPIDLQTTLSMGARSREEAAISVSSTLNPAITLPGDMPLKLKADVQGDERGTLTLDRSNGWIKKGEMESSFNGNVSFEDAPFFLPKDTSFPIKLSGKQTIETFAS